MCLSNPCRSLVQQRYFDSFTLTYEALAFQVSGVLLLDNILFRQDSATKDSLFVSGQIQEHRLAVNTPYFAVLPGERMVMPEENALIG